MKHYFSDLLDDEVIRCEYCGANALWNKEYPTCEGYRAYNKARNEALRAKVTNR